MSVSYPVAPRPAASNNFYAVAAALLSNGLSRRLDPFLSETRFPGNPTGKTVPPAGSGIRYCVSPKTGGAYKGAPISPADIAGEKFDTLSDSAFVTFCYETYRENETIVARLSAGISRFLASETAAGLSPEAREAIVSLRGSEAPKLPAPKRTRKAIPAA